MKKRKKPPPRPPQNPPPFLKKFSPPPLFNPKAQLNLFFFFFHQGFTPFFFLPWVKIRILRGMNPSPLFLGVRSQIEKGSAPKMLCRVQNKQVGGTKKNQFLESPILKLEMQG